LVEFAWRFHDGAPKDAAAQRNGGLALPQCSVHDQRGVAAVLPRRGLRPCYAISTLLRISYKDIREVFMASSTVFTSNRSQAVRLPKAVAFPPDVHQVDILKVGRSRVIVPKGKRWDDLFLSGPRVSEDFLARREQPAAEQREPL
jgi:antitoxin VapB